MLYCSIITNYYYYHDWYQSVLYHGQGNSLHCCTCSVKGYHKSPVIDSAVKLCVIKLKNDTMLKYKEINRSFQYTCVYRHQL